MVKVGDKLPSATLKHMDASGIQDITTEELTTGKKVSGASRRLKRAFHSAVGTDLLYVGALRRWSSSLCQGLSHQPAGDSIVHRLA